jgi:hypothetical protein
MKEHFLGGFQIGSMVEGEAGEVTSSSPQWPPSFWISATMSGTLLGVREVAISLWPAETIALAKLYPKPDEHPVTRYTFDMK